MSLFTVKISKTLRISSLGKLAAISFILALHPVTVKALPTPISSLLRLEANSDAGSGFIIALLYRSNARGGRIQEICPLKN